MKRKKAQSLSINTIIVAALALIVLVILASIFTGRIRIFSEGLQSCTAKQGKCYSNNCPSNTALVENTDCENKKPKQICCVMVLQPQSLSNT